MESEIPREEDITSTNNHKNDVVTLRDRSVAVTSQQLTALLNIEINKRIDEILYIPSDEDGSGGVYLKELHQHLTRPRPWLPPSVVRS